MNVLVVCCYNDFRFSFIGCPRIHPIFTLVVMTSRIAAQQSASGLRTPLSYLSIFEFGYRLTTLSLSRRAVTDLVHPCASRYCRGRRHPSVSILVDVIGMCGLSLSSHSPLHPFGFGPILCCGVMCHVSCVMCHKLTIVKHVLDSWGGREQLFTGADGRERQRCPCVVLAHSSRTHPLDQEFSPNLMRQHN